MVQLIFSFLLPKYNYAQSGTTQKLVQLCIAGTTRILVQLLVILFNIVLNVHHILNVYHVLNIFVETLMSSIFTSCTILTYNCVVELVALVIPKYI